MTDIPDYVGAVLNQLEAGGFKAYLVGGCLRDMLLGREIHDWDVATAARSTDIIALFPKTAPTGAKFGTVTVITGGGSVEVTTLRSDGVYSDKRRPDAVRFVDDLLEDLKRRDFTINAMAMTPAGILSDPFDGQGDLKRRLIRCVGRAEDRFSEDALRLFRALRFSAQLGFEIEAETMAAIKTCAPLCAALSAERVRDETEKMLMSGKPEIAFAAVGLGLFEGRIHAQDAHGFISDGLAGFPPGADGAAGKPEDSRPADSASDKSAPARRIARLPYDRQRRWSAFCAVIQHDGFIESAHDFLRDMRLDAKTVRNAGIGVEAALGNPLPQDRTGLKRLLAEIGVDASRCAAAAEEVLQGGSSVSRVEEAITSGECYSIAELAVTGDDLIALGYAPGVQLGLLLKQLLEHVISHPEDNKRELLMSFAKKIM